MNSGSKVSSRPASSFEKSKHRKSKSSIGMKEDNTIDTEVLKGSLQEFYRNSKEKLSNVKTEVELIETENNRQKEENILLNLKSNELSKFNDELTLRLKGMKEKVIVSHKHKFNLQNQVRDMKREIESTSRKIDTIKIDNNYKIQMIQNEIDHTQMVKEKDRKSVV